MFQTIWNSMHSKSMEYLNCVLLLPVVPSFKWPMQFFIYYPDAFRPSKGLLGNGNREIGKKTNLLTNLSFLGLRTSLFLGPPPQLLLYRSCSVKSFSTKIVAKFVMDTFLSLILTQNCMSSSSGSKSSGLLSSTDADSLKPTVLLSTACGEFSVIKDWLFTISCIAPTLANKVSSFVWMSRMTCWKIVKRGATVTNKEVIWNGKLGGEAFANDLLRT